jgi:hypothetical protein
MHAMTENELAYIRLNIGDGVKDSKAEQIVHLENDTVIVGKLSAYKFFLKVEFPNSVELIPWNAVKRISIHWKPVE